MPSSLYQWSETTPSSAKTSISSNTVTGDDWYPTGSSASPGVAGGTLDDYEALRWTVSIPSNTSGGTLVVVLQTSQDGVNWYDTASTSSVANSAGPFVYSCAISLATQQSTMTAIGSGGTPAILPNVVVGGPFGRYARLAMTAGSGTSSSLTITSELRAQRARVRETGE